MKAWKKPLVAVALFLGSTAGGYLGVSIFQNAQFARAQEEVQHTRQQLEQIEDLASVFRNVGKSVEPSVVNINVRKSVKGGGHQQLPFDDDMLRKFFPDRDGDGEPDLPEGFGGGGEDGQFEQFGTGSGVIMEAADGVGYIVTNNHVAGGATELTITLADGRTIDKAKVLGTDPKTDLAVIKIEADRLIPAQWGNSDDLRKGDWILAFGSPFGYIGSMTHGIVSALNRNNVGILGSQGYEDFIQVDAPINPGNSGGPLVNIRGEVVGINTAIASRTGGFQGIGFAIPSNQVKVVYSSLKENGKVSRGWLGVSISDVSRDLPKAESFGYSGKDGVLVEQTFPNTPAIGKLQPGDIITKIADKKVDNVQQLRTVVAGTAPGTDVNLTVFRDGKEQPVTIKIGEQPEDLMAAARGEGGGGGSGEKPAAEAKADQLGLRLGTLNEEMAKQLELDASIKGAVVLSVEPKSPAAKEGLRKGDVITKVGSTDVGSAEEAIDAIAKQDLTKGIRFYVTTREGARFVFVKGESK